LGGNAQQFWKLGKNEMGEAILDYVIRVANGEVRTKAELKGQEDFIPGKEASLSDKFKTPIRRVSDWTAKSPS